MSEVKTNGARSLGQGNIKVEGQCGEGRSPGKLHRSRLSFPSPHVPTWDLAILSPSSPLVLGFLSLCLLLAEGEQLIFAQGPAKTRAPAPSSGLQSCSAQGHCSEPLWPLHTGSHLPLDITEHLCVAQEAAEIYMEHVARGLQHDVVIVSVTDAQDVGSHTTARTRVDEVLHSL